ncbi:basic amino acid/polyamine antiporter [Demequina zhanjiangensis]|uniref:Basic amino acid/polyamine antiporter n=1 Tax=Demequina zhanjiangensis TaxID=3051659 RepID=A0ABT8G1W4_9MICO|nr:basic amino acid/polyamine antiporter [Demequina sp. SYSU T00b26]MDN4473088.1 basic amino acid/polyamine antiporter [Demequina sp. SYSU T00b26]
MTATHAPARTWPMPVLASMVIGSMVGAGVFSLPSSFAGSAGVAGAAIAWAVAGGGMLMLALVFQRLAVRRPDLDSGIVAYARAGFGSYVGFFSAFGYWASACIANVTYWVLLSSTLGAVVPGLGEGDTGWAFLFGTVGLWLFHLVIARGVSQAALLNAITTVAKIVPLVLFLAIVAVGGFSWDVFLENLRGDTTVLGPVAEQVRATMLVTVFVFLGVEGASVYSRYARRREDVGRATVVGFLSVLALFVAVTMLGYGVMPREELAGLRQPSVAGVLEAVVGPWGSWFIGIGLGISVLGAYLAWCLLAAEVLFEAATQEDAPRFLTRMNRHGVPIAALTATSVATQAFLIVTHFSASAFDFSLELTSALALLPYLLTAGFGLKEALGPRRWSGAVAIASIAVVYTAYLVYAAGMKYLLLALLVYAPASLLYVWARRERGLRVFTPWEAALCVGSVTGAVVAVVALATGTITL